MEKSGGSWPHSSMQGLAVTTPSPTLSLVFCLCMSHAWHAGMWESPAAPQAFFPRDWCYLLNL